MKNITIIGSGSFGTALSVVLARAGHKVRLWAREPEIAKGINNKHRNPSYISDVTLPAAVSCHTELADCLDSADMVVFATPSHVMREVAKRIRPYVRGDEIIVSVAKGIENDSFQTMSEVLSEVLEGKVSDNQIGVISGPSHAEEVSAFKPTTVVASANAKQTTKVIQEAFTTPMFRVYLNYDITGVQIGGAVKNIMAIAAGVVDGGNLGDNAKAAIMTRGLHEMKRLGMNLGASQDTFAGLSGMGDLVVTCTSKHSRNRYVGYNIGQGKKLDEIIEQMDMVAEGVKTTQSVWQWSNKLEVEMPITEAVYNVLFEREKPDDMVNELMTRHPKEEIVI